jgi:Undecaprenyl-phosphate glucose phosphotransferase
VKRLFIILDKTKTSIADTLMPAINLRAMLRASLANPRLIRGLECAALVVEAGLVFLSGTCIIAAQQSFNVATQLPDAAAVALVYAILLVVGEGTLRPPFDRQRPAAIRLLLFTFILSLLLIGHNLRTLAAMTLWFLLAGGAISSWRWVAMKIVGTTPSFTWPTRPAAFVGNSEAAARLYSKILNDPQRRISVVGFFDDRNERGGPLDGKLPNLGNIDSLVSYIHDHNLHDVYMALPWSAGERISQLIERMRFLPLTVHLVPDQLPPALRSGRANEIEGVIMPTLMLPPFSRLGGFAKRGIDMVAALALLIPLTPLFVLVAFAIKLDSRGPVFFLQRRIGQYGQSFDIFKFRSLTVADTDKNAESLVGRGDKRVTRVGRILRKYSIDELPQIINVLFGDMSLVGPRPHAPRAKADQRIYAEVLPDYMLRYRVKPGMTGWAQVNGWRGNTDTEEKLRKRVEFDFDYITTWSLIKDFQILARTLPSALFPPRDNV